MKKKPNGDPDLTPDEIAHVLRLLATPTVEALKQAGVYAPLRSAVRPLPLLTPARTPQQFRIRVDLVGAQPPLWRRLTLPSNLTLDQMHEVLQAAFEWTDSHLHQFMVTTGRSQPRTEAILTPFDVAEGESGVPESDLRLDQLLGTTGDKLYYAYDFGDDWRHVIKLETIEPLTEADAAVRCIGGRRRGAPEDVGGIYFYDELLAAATGPDHPDLEHIGDMIDDLGLWGFDDTIDLVAINARLP